MRATKRPTSTSLNSHPRADGVAAGRTTTTSRSCVPPCTTLVDGDGSYNNLLPNLDFDIGMTDSLKGRFSYSKTIARAGYGNLAAGQTANGSRAVRRINGFTPSGNQNNPGTAAAGVG